MEGRREVDEQAVEVVDGTREGGRVRGRQQGRMELSDQENEIVRRPWSWKERAAAHDRKFSWPPADCCE